MPLKNIFKHEKRKSGPVSPPPPPPPAPFTFIRTDTTSQTVIHPPTGFEDPPRASSDAAPNAKRRSLFATAHRRHKSTGAAPEPEPDWEKRAAALVSTPAAMTVPRPASAASSGASSLAAADDAVTRAIALHEAGDYSASTAMFGRLAADDNPLSQVLYGLALRHGWGTDKDEVRAVHYLQRAAQNSAALQSQALTMTAGAAAAKGSLAKGELTLAIYELANSYRNGWGVRKDPAAAREYYETAANLGDADAQNEAAWCYVNGFGCKKDKKKAAKYYRMAEKQGSKIPTNSWIYKDKYMDSDG